MKPLPVITAAALCAASAFAHATVQITEWMYNGNGLTGEYIEFTNVGAASVDFAGWSFADSSRIPGTTSLSAFGIVAPGESVILTEAVAATFQTTWSVSSVKVIGDNTANLGRNDEINIFDSANVLVDRLTYGDQNFPGTIRTQNRSGNPTSAADLASQTVTTGWMLASVGDPFSSYSSSLGDVGNPGKFTPVPEPSTYALLLAGLAVVAGIARRRSI